MMKNQAIFYAKITLRSTYLSYFPRILILSFRDFSPSRDLILRVLLFSSGHAKSSQLFAAPLIGGNIHSRQDRYRL